MPDPKVYIGTSGWSFNWQQFVDEDIPSKNKLTHFSKYFDTVEVNYTFYNLPQTKTVDKWREQTADDFVFALKISQYITHNNRLSRVKTATKKFLRRYQHLEEKAGPVLLQLPPSLEADAELLKDFLQDAEDDRKELDLDPLPLAFEFRDESWYSEEITDLLSEYDACLVFGHSSKYPYPEEEPLTSSRFVYFRLHGPEKMYGSEYGEERLKKWKDKIEKYGENRDVYVYFDNDQHGYAAKDAFALKAMIEEN